LDNRTILNLLEELAQRLDVEIRYESLEGEAAFSGGGLCRIRGRRVIIVNRAAAPDIKVRTIAAALRRFDLGEIYVKPALREFMETVADEPDPENGARGGG